MTAQPKNVSPAQDLAGTSRVQISKNGQNFPELKSGQFTKALGEVLHDPGMQKTFLIDLKNSLFHTTDVARALCWMEVDPTVTSRVVSVLELLQSTVDSIVIKEATSV